MGADTNGCGDLQPCQPDPGSGGLTLVTFSQQEVPGGMRVGPEPHHI